MAVVAQTEERPWLEQLNDEQRAAATHSGGPLLILAGAGTGKTTTLCARVAWLVTEGVPAERILLLTFTRRASREMLQRARGLVPASSRVLGGTFHSVAHRLVRRHAAALGLPSGFGVLDAGDAADVLDLLREEHGHAASRTRFPRKGTLLDIYSRTVNAQQPLSGVISTHFPWCEEHREAISALFKAYTARKRELGVADLDDLLLFWRALAADDVIGPLLAASFDHVLIDEYQDVNGLQVDLARSLGSHGPVVTAVGDDFQAIYGFRSASAAHILDFPEHFPGTRVVTLERNYRSTQPVLDAANALAAQADARVPEAPARGPRGRRAAEGRPRARRGGAGRGGLRPHPRSARAGHGAARPGRAGAHVARLGPAGARAHAAPDPVPQVRRAALPGGRARQGLRGDAAAGRQRRRRRRLVPRAAARRGRRAGERAPRDRGDGGRAAAARDGAAARRRARRARAPSATASRPGRRPRTDPVAARASADALIAALFEARSEPRPGPRAEGLRDVLAPLIRLRYPDGALRVQDLDQLVDAAHQASDPRHFVAELVLDPPSSSADIAQPPHLDEDYLTISTIHSAKGLEWDSVHVLAVYDGNFPACMAAGTSEEIDEERRLLYVGMTRARRTLTLYVPVRYHHRPHGRDDAHGYGKPSRFLTPEVLATCDVTRLPDDPLNPYGAPLVTAPAPRRDTGRAVRLSAYAPARRSARPVAPSATVSATIAPAAPRALAGDDACDATFAR